ncbi:MAG TPA: UDP-3-O-(3-hydroxymyristoyl)glucosamine N-acyltransferase [Acidisarcina sp.]|nr:UDP-3-O-(3-hydroxymyristoyl)glucosamine N-acyltransferase [Acidisarcina sp.]
MKLAELARILQAECRGDGNLEITGVAGIEEAGPHQVTFVANLKYAAHARTTRAGAILVQPDFPEIPTATLRTSNPYLGFARAIEAFYQLPVYAPGIHPTAVIDPTARLGQNAHVGAYAVVGAGVVIGNDATLLPHVVIYPNTRIGNRFFAHAHAIVREGCILGNNVTLQNGVVIGADGFGFAKDDAGHWHKILQSGIVRMADDIEIQAQSCVDRAAVGETRIARGVKIDNVTTVGHGTTIGEDSLICAQVGLAGSTHIGKNVVLAGQVGIAGHCTIGDGVIVTAQSGTHGDVEPGKIISGTPGFDHNQWMRASNAFPRLPELMREVKRLQRKISPEE